MNKTGVDVPVGQLLYEFSPRSDWFVSNPFGIHGVSHAQRVVLLQFIIQSVLKTEKTDLNPIVLCLSACIHDTQRLNEFEDPGHGERSAIWVKKKYDGDLGSKELELVMYLCRWHSVSDNKIPEMNLELRILKDADALDRVRFDGLDQNKLRFKESKKLILLSEKLYHCYHDQ